MMTPTMAGTTLTFAVAIFVVFVSATAAAAQGPSCTYTNPHGTKLSVPVMYLEMKTERCLAAGDFFFFLFFFRILFLHPPPKHTGVGYNFTNLSLPNGDAQYSVTTEVRIWARGECVCVYVGWLLIIASTADRHCRQPPAQSIVAG